MERHVASVVGLGGDGPKLFGEDRTRKLLEKWTLGNKKAIWENHTLGHIKVVFRVITIYLSSFS